MERHTLVELITKKVLEQMHDTVLPTKEELLSIPIGVSARHLHLCKEDVETLFGKGYGLTPFKELMGGQYAAKETVMIVGTKLRPIENVRVLGPLRSKTQVEVSKTDAIRLGINPPIRPSGDLAGSAPIVLIGPKGAVTLKEGCIVAERHIHMSPQDAVRFGVKDQEIVTVKILSDRGGSLDHVLVRVDETFTLEMHIDTDEANGMGIKCGEQVVIQ